MNISTLLVLVFAAMSAYGYPLHHQHHHLPCLDCNNPCSKNILEKVEGEYSKLLSLPDCKKNKLIGDEANPTWECDQIAYMDGVHQSAHNATCGKCEEDSATAKPILQDFNMLFRKSCGNSEYFILQLKTVTFSVGCKCVED